MPAAFGVALGSTQEAEGTGTQTTALTTGAAHTAGHAVRVGIGVSNSSATVNSVTDSAGNTYVQRTAATYGGSKTELWSSTGAAALGAGGTVTVTTGGLVTRTVTVVACTDTGLAAESGEVTDGATSAGPSVELDPATSGGIAYGLLLAETNIPGSEDTNWTNVDSEVVTSPANEFRMAYRLTAGSAITYEPAISGSVDWVALVTDFAENTALGSAQRLPLLGVS